MNKLTKIALAIVAIAGLSIGTIAYANPSAFGGKVRTGNTASSTPAFVVAGVSTSTTPTYNAYSQTVSGGKTTKADRATLAVQFAASSTATTLNLAIEYSNDGIDWYRNFVLDTNQMGTTTTPFNLLTSNSITWKFASSTVGGAALTNANSATGTAYMIIPTPAQYTRVVGSMTGGNGALWMEITPIKEQF